MRYVIIKNNEVINAIEFDSANEFTYPFNHDDIIRSDELLIGMKLIGCVWKFETLNLNCMVDQIDGSILE
jgi:hypothetical protein